MTIIRSRRKTISVCVKPDGSVIVRAPLRMPEGQIDAFVQSKEGWIRKNQEKLRKQREQTGSTVKLSSGEIKALSEKAKQVIPERVSHYARLMGAEYGGITIRCQKTRWGSCSAKGNLNFNCLLMLTPPEVIDSVVVHELCHLKVMNHSARFYEEVKKFYPEYDRWNRWLKENGSSIMAKR